MDTAGFWCNHDMFVMRVQGELKSQRQAVAERDQHAQDLLDVIHQQVPAWAWVLMALLGKESARWVCWARKLLCEGGWSPGCMRLCA